MRSVEHRSQALSSRSRASAGRLLAWTLGGLVFALATACSEEPTATPTPTPPLRLADTQFESLWVNNAIAQFIIEEGYEYPVVVERMSSQTLEDWLPQGLVDIQMEGWEQNRADWYAQAVGAGSIENLGPIYEDGPQFFMIPEWVHQRYGIDTVFDLEEHWEVFVDPDDPTRGFFINCILAWECAGINQIKLEAYGLSDNYNMVSPGDSPELAGMFADRAREGEPVVGYYWAPNALMALHDWHVLEEPLYTDACWEAVLAAVEDSTLPASEACAYKSVPINKIVSSELKAKAPDIHELLSRMSVGLKPLNETLAWMQENGFEDYEDYDQSAIYYLQTYADRWRSWMPEDNANRVQKALDRLEES